MGTFICARPFVNTSYTYMKSSIISEVDSLELQLLHYGEEYQEKVLLLVHGYGETSVYYEPLAKHVSKNYKVHVIAYDQREHGIHKNGVPRFTSYENYISDFIQILGEIRNAKP